MTNLPVPPVDPVDPADLVPLNPPNASAVFGSPWIVIPADPAAYAEAVGSFLLQDFVPFVRAMQIRFAPRIQCRYCLAIVPADDASRAAHLGAHSLGFKALALMRSWKGANGR